MRLYAQNNNFLAPLVISTFIIIAAICNQLGPQEEVAPIIFLSKRDFQTHLFLLFINNGYICSILSKALHHPKGYVILHAKMESGNGVGNHHHRQFTSVKFKSLITKKKKKK